jgi:short-subunit dehydrogenase
VQPRWRGKVVVITGASAGVGRAVARVFARDGANVALLARGADGLEAARREATAAGVAALAIALDVADAAAVESAADRIERELGPIDAWINNATVSVFSPVLDMRAEEYRRVTEVTYLGAVHGTLAALRRMAPRDRGCIVQIGSALAYRSIPLQSAYCAAKQAMSGFTESLRVELLHDRRNIQIVMVQLPALNTPQFDWSKSRMPSLPQPVPPLFQPEVAAEAIAWAAAHPRREVKVGWPTVLAIWADRLVPALADRYLARSGYEAQQSDDPAPLGHRDNLWDPVPGDHGAHGRFDARARGFSLQTWLNTRGRGVAVAACAAVIAGALVARQRTGRRERRRPERLMAAD